MVCLIYCVFPNQKETKKWKRGACGETLLLLLLLLLLLFRLFLLLLYRIIFRLPPFSSFATLQASISSFSHTAHHSLALKA